MNGTTGTSWLLHTLIGGGLLLLAAWAWTAWTRQPVRRLRVAESAIVASLVLALLSLGPAWLVVTTPAEPPPVAVHAPAAPVYEIEPQKGWASAAPAPVAAPMPRKQVPEIRAPREPAPAPLAKAPAALPPSQPVVQTATAPAGWSIDADRVASIASALYLTAGFVVLGRWLFGWAVLHRLLRRCVPVGGRAAELFAEMAGPGRRPRLLASRHVRAPFSCGLLRPTVVLPAALCEAADEALRWVFAHELAHLRRRDAWSGLLFGLAQAVYFPVPWFWRLRRQARLCQEYLADAAAASAGGRPEDYAQFLLAWTAAPRPPVGAHGVWGRSSDLFWRVKTMLHNRTPLERRCPRRWSLAAACGLLSLAVLAAGFTLRAAAAPAAEPNKEEPKKEQPKAPNVEQQPQLPALPDLALPDVNVDELLKNMPNLDPNQAKLLREQMRQAREQLRRAMQLQGRQGGFGGGFPINPGFPNAQPQEGRLGVTVEKPGDALVNQLELPGDQGLVIRDMKPDSAAAHAGLKEYDILLELDGKPVPSNPEEFRQAVDAIKANTPVDVVVMRKGRKETIKGLSLPEAKAADAQPGLNPNLPQFPPNFPNIAPNFPNINVANGGNVSISTSRTNDHFTTTRLEPGLIVQVTGTIDNGKAKLGQVMIQDANSINRYDCLEKTPEKFRDQAKSLLEMTEKGSVKVDVIRP
ncbi:MAG TPA: M56 family metallopeptidase [Gemmataceae bacterium]|nr:M56 family metallopeptidase [Gemmataceae bacterium]